MKFANPNVSLLRPGRVWLTRFPRTNEVSSTPRFSGVRRRAWKLRNRFKGFHTAHNGQSMLALVLAIAGTFVLVGGLVYIMRHYTQPPPIDQARIQERRKFLTEIQSGNAEALNNYAWQDQAKGLIRLPITNAMELTIREYQNPAAARSNLAARAEKAFAPAPKAPEKPSPYE